MPLISRLGLHGAPARAYGFQQGDGPNEFDFVAQMNVALSTIDLISNQVIITGLSQPATINASGSPGFGYSLNGGAFVQSDGTVNNGDTLRLQVDASANYSTGTFAQITINQLIRSFIVRTLRDPTPVVVERAPITPLHGRR